MPEHKIPLKFKKWKIMWDRWFGELKEYELNATEACLSYPLSLSEIDYVVVGVDSVNQLKDLIKISQFKKIKHDWSFMNSNDKLLINPNNWNLF